MPIVSSVISKQRNRGNGSLHVMERHTDHLGINHDHRYYCATNHNTAQTLIDWAISLETSLISDEEQEVYRFLVEGGDPEAASMKYITTRQRTVQCAKALMSGNPRNLLRAAEFINSFTDEEIESEATIAQRVRIRARASYIIDNQSIISSDLREEM